MSQSEDSHINYKSVKRLEISFKKKPVINIFMRSFVWFFFFASIGSGLKIGSFCGLDFGFFLHYEFMVDF